VTFSSLSTPDWVALNAGFALACLGLTACAQWRWYPEFRRIAPADFPAHHRRHTRKLGLLAPPALLGDLAVALAFSWSVRSGDLSGQFLLADGGALLTLVAWLSTFLLQVPLHRRLERGPDPEAVEELLRSNRLRLIAWALKSLLFGIWWLA
jgi:hypothetical protein